MTTWQECASAILLWIKAPVSPSKSTLAILQRLEASLKGP